MAEVRTPLIEQADGSWIIPENASICDVLRHLMMELGFGATREDLIRHVETMEL